jgi:hypothetical protein
VAKSLNFQKTGTEIGPITGAWSKANETVAVPARVSGDRASTGLATVCPDGPNWSEKAECFQFQPLISRAKYA